ncbi:MAG: ATP-dependent zinc metalloprotease FtsH [Planctomycetes bacterium]|nr:ATP-dependent zinc metalloprotease FtsH [Planctomycetota bacterium]
MKPRKEPEPSKRPRSRPVGSLVFGLIFLLLVIVSLYNPLGALGENEKISINQFQEKLVTGEVAKFVMEPEGEVKGEYYISPKAAPAPKESSKVFGNAFGDNSSARHFRLYFPEIRDRLFAFQKRVRRLDATSPWEAPGLTRKLEDKTAVANEAILLAKTEENGQKRTRLFVDLIDDDGKQKYVEIVGGTASRPDGSAGGGADIARIASLMRDQRVPLEVVTVDAGVETVAPNTLLVTLLMIMFPLVLLFMIVWFIILKPIRSSGPGGGLLGFGRSRAVLYTKENRTNVTFDDVAGIDEAKEEVKEVIEFLKNPQRFARLGGRIPRGILLAGPPGTGKTLLAKAIAGEAEVPFFSISGSDFVEMFVGVGASRVRDLFKQAKENAPCIIFLDEIDAVGRKRGSGFNGGHDEREQTLNAILVEMDGFDTNEGIIVVASTNRPDVLDPALLRPGRFDREVAIDLPDVKGREEILKVHARRIKLAADIEMQTLARATPMFSGADLAALLNEAAIIAVLKKRDAVFQEDLEEARDKVMFGRQKKSRVMREDERTLIARHEAGHALVASLVEGAEPIHKVTIIPRGIMGGATMMLPEQDRMGMTQKEANARLCVDYGGRVAEELLNGDVSTGAASDFAHATRFARMMVCEWGFSTKIGPMSYSERQGSEYLGSDFMAGRFHSEDTAHEIDVEVRRICNEAYEQTKKILTENVASLEKITEALLQYETITGAELKQVLAGTPIPQLRPPAPAQPAATPPPAATTAKPRSETSPRMGFPDAGLSPA